MALVARRKDSYMGIENEKRKYFPEVERTFLIATYQAYDAFGLIGPEHNGIVIFNLDRNVVVCDRIAKQTTGYHGASAKQVELFHEILDMTWEKFVEFVNRQPYRRYITILT